MNDDQRRALEHVRDTCAMLHSFDAVTAAQNAGVPEQRIFDSM